MGDGDCNPFITHCLWHSFLLTLFPCSSIWSLSWTSSTCVLPVGLSSSLNAPVSVLSTGCHASGTDCSSVGPPRGHKSCQQTRSGVGSSLHGSSPARTLLKHRLCRDHSLLQASTYSGVGSSQGCRWVSAPPWTYIGCSGTACPTMVFTRGCRGITALVPGAPHSSPSSLTLSSATLFLSHILTPLSCFKMPFCRFFFFSNMLSRRHCHHHRWACPWPTADLSWSRLALALSDTGESSSSFPQKPSL